MNEGFNPRTLILVLGVLGLVVGAWLGTLIDHQTIFLGLWSGLLATLGAIGGIALGSFLAKYL